MNAIDRIEESRKCYEEYKELLNFSHKKEFSIMNVNFPLSFYL